MSYETLLYSIEAGVARITLNRPDAGHTVNGTFGREFMDAAIAAATDPNVRCVVLGATGSVFGFGGDLKYFESERHRLGACLLETTATFHQAIQRLHHMNAPVIVSVNGIAAGAGFSMALIGDIVLAAEGAKFKMAYTAAALAPDGSSTFYLPRLVGLRRAQELFITNRTLSSAEALEWGIVTRVVPDADLAAETDALAAQLAAGPTLAYGSVKRMLSRSLGNSLEAQMELESREITAMAQTADGREGIDAFIAKRKPVFKGK